MFLIGAILFFLSLIAFGYSGYVLAKYLLEDKEQDCSVDTPMKKQRFIPGGYFYLG